MNTEDNYIFQTHDKITQNNNPADTGDILYTISEYADSTDSNGCNILNKDNGQHVYAKRIVKEDNTIKYMIKTDTRGKLMNPLSIYGQEKVNNFLDKTCKDNKFRTVNFRTFDMYLKFLNTKNLSWLHNAEREAE